MPLSQRRRPPPLQLVPRQTPAPTPTGEEGDGEEGPDSPDSVGTTPGLDSPDTPSPTGAPGEIEDEEDEEEKEEEEEEESPEDGSPTGGPTAVVPGASSTSAPTGIASRVSAEPQITDASSQRPTSTATVTGVGPGGVTIDRESPQKAVENHDHHGGMSKGAEAALITVTVLGGIALIIGAYFFLRRRRRAKQGGATRNVEDAFNPGNAGSLAVPETVHNPHLTRSTNTTSLFAAADYQRPETVSTNPSRSRIPPPQPTPNPFIDPPLNKAYDVLRGRVRSTTLTDRGSWIKNPFKDPVSERFDPFGELQEKARLERLRYMEELRLEQEYLEKEKMGLGVPRQDLRKGSGVTVEGVGILDRSTAGYPR